MAEPGYWLLKCNVKYDKFDDLLAKGNQPYPWHGVRNYQSRNFMRDEIKVGDKALFYHTGARKREVVGTVTVVRAAYPDYSAWDEKSPFHDPSSTPVNPKWLMVDIQADLKFANPVTLREIKASNHPALQGMMLVQPGNRLSIQPVSKAAWDLIVALGMGGPAVPPQG